MHEAIVNSRDLIILLTEDYLRSPYTRKEFTSFEAERVTTAEERHIIVLRCEDVPLRGLLADNVYQDLVGVQDPEERKRRIVAAADRQTQAAPPPPRPFIGVPPRIASFTGRSGELDRLDAILMRDKPATVTQASVGRAALRANDGETSESLKFSLGAKDNHRGHATQRREDGRCRRGWRGGRPEADRSAGPGGGGARDVGSASASDFYGADEASCSGGD